jgi:hypothetical protein
MVCFALSKSTGSGSFMEKFCPRTLSYKKRIFFGLVALVMAVFFPLTVVAQITVDTTISADTTSNQVIGANNITVTNDAPTLTLPDQVRST